MLAADVAADAVDPERPGSLADYEDGWRDALRTEQRLGALVRRAYALPRPLQRLGLRVFSGRIGVHMDHPSSVFSGDQLRAMLSR